MSLAIVNGQVQKENNKGRNVASCPLTVVNSVRITVQRFRCDEFKFPLLS